MSRFYKVHQKQVSSQEHKRKCIAALECGLIPLFVRVHPADNVAIIVAEDGAAPGTHDATGFTVRERIPQSHKVALARMQKGEPVMRYGQTIGMANRDVEMGSWVREEDLDLLLAAESGRNAVGNSGANGVAHARWFYV